MAIGMILCFWSPVFLLYLVGYLLNLASESSQAPMAVSSKENKRVFLLLMKKRKRKKKENNSFFTIPRLFRVFFSLLHPLINKAVSALGKASYTNDVGERG